MRNFLTAFATVLLALNTIIILVIEHDYTLLQKSRWECSSYAQLPGLDHGACTQWTHK